MCIKNELSDFHNIEHMRPRELCNCPLAALPSWEYRHCQERVSYNQFDQFCINAEQTNWIWPVQTTLFSVWLSLQQEQVSVRTVCHFDNLRAM